MVWNPKLKPIEVIVAVGIISFAGSVALIIFNDKTSVKDLLIPFINDSTPVFIALLILAPLALLYDWALKKFFPKKYAAYQASEAERIAKNAPTLFQRTLLTRVMIFAIITILALAAILLS